MTRQVYFVGIRWGEPDGPRLRAVEQLLDPLGDWIRFNEHTWFLSTARPASEIYNRLGGALTANGSVIVIALDPKDRFGWAPDWLWGWLGGQEQDPPKTAAEIISRDLPGHKDDKSTVEEAATG